MKKALDRLRVAVLIDAWFPFQGGGQVHVRETTERLSNKHNCEVVIFHGFSEKLFCRLFWNFLVILQVSFAHFRKRFDLLHAHAYSAGLSGKILSLILKIPIVYTIHGSNSLDIFSSPKLRKSFGRISLGFRLKYFLEKWLLTGIKYDAQISVAGNFLDYPNLNKRIYVIPNGVNLDKFKPTQVKKKRNITRLLFVGRLEKIKGVDVLLRALSKVKNKIANFELVIIGRGGEKEYLRKLTVKLDLKEKVRFLGKLVEKDLAGHYLKADIFILPSLTEGQPLTLLEAWAAKLPVIVTKVGQNPFMIEEEKEGFLAQPGSIKDLSEAILKAFKEKNKWEEMGKRGYLKAKNNYTWERTVQKTAQIYQEVLK